MASYVVVFRPEAEAEVLEARQWYESRSEGLGRRFDGKGRFSRTVTFAAPAATRVYALADGDINADGNLDVVAGYAGREFIAEESGGKTLLRNQLRDEPNRVYLNDGKGNLSAGPGFGLGNVTRALALGDVDGDGRLDKVLGTNCGENVIYLNRPLIDGPPK